MDYGTMLTWQTKEILKNKNQRCGQCIDVIQQMHCITSKHMNNKNNKKIKNKNKHTRIRTQKPLKLSKQQKKVISFGRRLLFFLSQQGKYSKCHRKKGDHKKKWALRRCRQTFKDSHRKARCAGRCDEWNLIWKKRTFGEKKKENQKKMATTNGESVIKLSYIENISTTKSISTTLFPMHFHQFFEVYSFVWFEFFCCLLHARTYKKMKLWSEASGNGCCVIRQTVWGNCNGQIHQ